MPDINALSGVCGFELRNLRGAASGRTIAATAAGIRLADPRFRRIDCFARRVAEYAYGRCDILPQIVKAWGGGNMSNNRISEIPHNARTLYWVCALGLVASGRSFSVRIGAPGAIRRHG
jgi:hypothetical protein